MGCTHSHEKCPHCSNQDVYTKTSPIPQSTSPQSAPLLGNGKALMMSTSSAASSSQDTGDQYFSHQQKTLLRETWSIVGENQQLHGIAIFVHIFSKEPETKQLFPTFSDARAFGVLNRTFEVRVEEQQ